MMLRGVVGRGASPKHHDTFYPPEVYTIRSHGADGRNRLSGAFCGFV
jgi:hypothetical protein